MKAWLFGISATAVAGCSSIEPIGAASSAASTGRCEVTVYQTHQQALKHGAIEELCVISGTSAFSFSHTAATAIAKHKDKACACGADKVYVQSRHETGWDLATVTMVAFRHVRERP